MIASALGELLRRGGQHAATIDEMQATLAREGTAADYSTIFRALGKLEERGAVRRLTLEDGRTRYELASDHHDHVRCERCGAIAAVPCNLGEIVRSKLEALTGYAITGHRLVFTGACDRCRPRALRRRRALPAAGAR